VNTAILIATAAWLSTAQVEPVTPPANSAEVPPVVCGGTCRGSFDPYHCESFGCRLRDKMRGLFARDRSQGNSAPADDSEKTGRIFASPPGLWAQDWEEFRYIFGSTREARAQAWRDVHYIFGPPLVPPR